MEKVNDELKEKLKDNTVKIRRDDTSFDTQYYQLKCATLEKNIKELTTKFTKELMKYNSNSTLLIDYSDLMFNDYDDMEINVKN